MILAKNKFKVFAKKKNTYAWRDCNIVGFTLLYRTAPKL